MIEQIVSFAPGDPETLRIDTSKLRTLEIDGVKYSAELFRTFAAPDTAKYYQLVRKGETVTVTEFHVSRPRVGGGTALDFEGEIAFLKELEEREGREPKP